MSEAPLLFSVEDGITRLTLNRPDAGNAIDLPMGRALLDASILCQTDKAIRCVVLTGAGRLFARAADKAEVLLSELAGTLHMALARFARMNKPLVTLVNGQRRAQVSDSPYRAMS